MVALPCHKQPTLLLVHSLWEDHWESTVVDGKLARGPRPSKSPFHYPLYHWLDFIKCLELPFVSYWYCSSQNTFRIYKCVCSKITDYLKALFPSISDNLHVLHSTALELGGLGQIIAILSPRPLKVTPALHASLGLVRITGNNDLDSYQLEGTQMWGTEGIGKVSLGARSSGGSSSMWWLTRWLRC